MIRRALVALLLLLIATLLRVPGLPPARAEAPPAAPQPLEIRFLDVGQGDAVLIRTPAGKTVMVDGGKPTGRAPEQLRALGVSRIDLLLATHADYDHMGVHEEILKRFPVSTYITNGLPHTTASYRRTLELARRLVAEGRLKVYNAGSFRPGQDLGSGGIGLHLLPPPPGVPGDEQNLHSVGLVVTYGPFKAVMTGDSEAPELRAWLAQTGVPALVGDADVYKAVHHGARDGDPAHPAWLARIDPEVVVVPVGENAYGHPTPEALAAYRAQGARIYRTDLHGTVTVRAWPDGRYTVEAERGETPAAPPRPAPPESRPALPPAPAGAAIPPSPSGDCPPSHPIKGNRGSNGRIFHVPGGASYERTRAEECFATAEDARAAGYRPPGR